MSWLQDVLRRHHHNLVKWAHTNERFAVNCYAMLHKYQKQKSLSRSLIDILVLSRTIAWLVLVLKTHPYHLYMDPRD